jgi:hypothetical protein
VRDEMVIEVQTWKTSSTIWTHLKDFHETSYKGGALFLKNMFSMMMDEHASLQENLLKIKEIQKQFMANVQEMEEEDMVVITSKFTMCLRALY